MLVPLDLPQGLYRQGTVYQAKGRWYEAQLVRFLEDTVRPIGGWTRMSESVAASLYASDLFTTDPGNVSLDFTTSGYVSDQGFGGWDVETPADKQLEPDPSTHLAFKTVTGGLSIKSRSAIPISDFAAYMDVLWTDGDDGDTQVGMYVRTNDEYQTDVGSEGFLFAVRMHHAQSGLPLIKTVDTFTEGGDPFLEAHTSDDGCGYDVTQTSTFQVSTSRGVVEGYPAYTSAQRYGIQDSGSGGQCSVGDEAFCDMYRAQGQQGGGTSQGFLFMCSGEGVTPTDRYHVLVSQISGSTVIPYISRFYSGGSEQSGALTNFEWPMGSGIRVGVTMVSNGSFQLWTEPYGGGARTLIELWSPGYDANYDFFDSSSHVYMGIQQAYTGNMTGDIIAWDNLTVETPGGGTPVPAGFQIYAYRVIDGTPYALSDDGGATVENDYFDTVDWSDGFRFGVDLEGSEASAWYQAFGATSTKVYLDWIGFTAGDPLDLTYDAGGSTDDFDDAGHQFSGIWENIEAATVGTEIYRYEYQQIGFSGPFDLVGVPRGAHGWEQASVGWLAFGTNEQLYTYSTGFLYEITPAGFLTGRVDTETSEENSGRYGRGVYGNLTYGTGQQGIVETFEADVWHFDTFEDSLMSAMVPTDATLYEWNPVWGGTAPALAVTIANGYAEDAPAVGRGIVVTPERFMCILGPDGANRDVAWASRETIDIWTIDPLTPANTAGQQTLDGKGRIMRGMRGRGETIIWTDADVFAMTYQAGEYIYGFERRGFNCGLISSQAVADIGSMFVWMSLRGFFIYDGYSRVLECPVQDAVFNELDFDQRAKICAIVNQMYGEVWWFYPSVPADVDAQGENDRYVVYNFREELWTMGKLERTCGVEASASAKNPLMLSPQGWAYNHEVGWLHPDESGVEIVPYIESGPVQLGEGDTVLSATKLIPDEKNLGDVQAYFYGSFWPMEDEVEYGPYTLTDETDVRITARQIRIRLEQNIDDDWRVGIFRFEAIPGSAR